MQCTWCNEKIETGQAYYLLADLRPDIARHYRRYAGAEAVHALHLSSSDWLASTAPRVVHSSPPEQSS